VTSQDGTARRPALAAHPRRAEVLAHEAVHRAQFALAGRGPTGAREELEAEARLGAWAALHGQGFSPKLAAAPDMELAFDHASAGGHLQEFIAWLAENTSYDVDAVDWNAAILALLASTRIYHHSDKELAVLASIRFRYRLLIEIFDQERAAGLPGPQQATAGRIVPTIGQLEDELFDRYLPSLSTESFAPADVQKVSDAFLAHYLTGLSGLSIVPATFDIREYRPPPRTPDIQGGPGGILDRWIKTEVKDLAFRFLLDDFARAVGGPHATVSTLPPLFGSGTQRQLSPERWLATLDLTAYKDRLVKAMTGQAVKRLSQDAEHQRQLRTAADEQSRFETLHAMHAVISGFDSKLKEAVNDLPRLAYSELTPDDMDVAGEPFNAFQQFSAVSAAATTFYGQLSTSRDNDTVMLAAAGDLAKAIGSTPRNGQLVAELVRLGTAIRDYEAQLESSRQAIEQRLRVEIQVNYDEIAAGIQQMGAFADAYLQQTFVPTMNRIALERITANVKVLRDRRDNWVAYSATTAKKLAEYAGVLDDFARGLRDGSYNRIEVQRQTLTVRDVKQLEDAAKICRAEAEAMRQPASRSGRYKKLSEALDGFEGVKTRIEKGEIPANRYGPDVFNAARKELRLDSFRDFTTYGDIVFGRDVAAENPFLARLVIGWKLVEELDEGLRTVTIFAALSLLTVASLLIGVAAAAFLPSAASHAVAVVLFAVDAAVNIGLGWHDKNQAEAFRDMVRLDLDHSVTGVSEEDAERALKMAWFGLLLAVGLTAGAVALAGYARFTRGVSEGFELSVRYFTLAREEPELFASLRGIVTDPARLDRMLQFAEDAKHLESLLNRMDHVLDLPMVERLLAATGDAARAAKVLDVASDARVADTALTRLVTKVAGRAARTSLLDLAGQDAVSLLAVLDRTSDATAARRLFTLVPDARRLAGILDLPTAAGLTDDAIRAMGRLEPDALKLLKSASATDIADLVRLVEQDPAGMNALFGTGGSQILRQVQRAPYDTVAALRDAVGRSAARLGPQPGYETLPVPKFQEKTELVPGWKGLLAKKKAEFITTVTSPSGKPLSLKSSWDSAHGELSLETAFANPEIELVPEAPFLVERKGQRGTPASVYFTLQQMRAAKIPYGAPGSAGGIQSVRLSQIQNMETLVHLQWLRQRYPQAALEDLVADTAIVKYGETIANQAGYRVVHIEVDMSNSWMTTAGEQSDYYARPARAQIRGMTPEAVRLENQRVLARFGISPGAPLPANFDVVLHVRPW